MGMRKGMDFLAKRLELRRPSPEHTLYVMYTADRSNGEVLAQKLEELGYSIPSEHIINVGAAIGSHIGPNACGLVYVGEQAKQVVIRPPAFLYAYRVKPAFQK